eukprot:scaffold246882_cov60-Attheya_sp.AAC.1
MVRKTLTSRPASVSSNQKNEYYEAWGQQCSPQCGCVVRFEATIDASSDAIVSATYHAKSVVVSNHTASNNASNNHRTNHHVKQMVPTLTTKGRPMFTKDCQCETLQQLAQGVTTWLSSQQRTVAQVSNSSLQFGEVRSSEAFRHTVLKQQLLHNKNPHAHTHCYDLVEEAFTALIRGHMPQPRRHHPHQQPFLFHDHNQHQQPHNIHPNHPNKKLSSRNNSVHPSFHYGTSGPQSTMVSFSSSPPQSSSSSSLPYGADGPMGFFRTNISSSGGGGSSLSYPFSSKNDNDDDPLHPEDGFYHPHPPHPTSTTTVTTTVSLITDWVSYVDEMYRTSQEEEEKQENAAAA